MAMPSFNTVRAAVLPHLMQVDIKSTEKPRVPQKSFSAAVPAQQLYDISWR